VTLELKVSMVPRRIMGPPASIQQVVLNLITNAADAMDGRETRVLRVSTERTPVSEEDLLRLNVRAQFPNAVPGNYVVLHVGDTGRGSSRTCCRESSNPISAPRRLFRSSIRRETAVWV
jgi:signal transduction histidine kinase